MPAGCRRLRLALPDRVSGRRVAALALGLYLLSPIPVGFTINHFADRDFAWVSGWYAPLS